MTETMQIQPEFTTIWVTFQKEGIHCYPAAGDLEGVEFLQHPHRHMFHFNIEIEVFHDDRDIEFILFKRELESLYNDGVLELNHKSCEMLARDILHYIVEKYKKRDVTVSVSEDGENGGRIRYKKPVKVTDTDFYLGDNPYE